MPISTARADRHVADWSTRAGKVYWPKYLFHTAHVTVAVGALSDNKLICRQMQDKLIHDVANPGAIASNVDALKYVRLYFRPRTHFHLRTEGVKFRNDPNRQENQMSIPIILMFDFVKVVTQGGVGFSNGKMAHFEAKSGFDEMFFNSIPFADVYHDGALSQTRIAEVNERRMSEVIMALFALTMEVPDWRRFVVRDA